ncbi:class I adenylate-forming enzyme family protein [Nocardioides houyundeii]|uniref:class I adenylate-forming enzyme family protein n=1 Tax=Nocardioides houyundeii TaxID=2045452 RepID=UPI000C779038|nr:class I adenylate-forming enzyme family protein [Nocardioides houyundeii]
MSQPRPSHLDWQGAESLPEDVRAALLGDDAPFELVTESVLGHDHTVFKQRARTLREMLEDQVAASADLPLLISPDRTWTYAQTLQDVDAMALLLRQRYSVGVGDRVAIVAANSAEYAILMWAIISSGAIVSSLNGWWTTPELEYGIELSKPVLVTGDARRLARLEQGSVPSEVPVKLLDELFDEAREYHGPPLSPPALDEDSPAVILFTSGTTGRPKGATLSHRNIINFAMINRLSAAMAVAGAPPSPPAPAGTPRPQGATILSSPMFHISGMVATLITAAAFPSKLIFPSPGAWEPETWLELTSKHRVSIWSGVPTQFLRLLRHPALASYDISSVMTIGGGGAVFSPELVREMHAKLPGIRLSCGFGMSETVGVGTITGGDLFLNIPESVGAAQPTTQVEVRDAMGTVLPEGQIGEIHIHSPSVFLGYWDNPGATANVLDEDRWYSTGDFGRIENGLLFLESRRSDMILRGGENIYPIEIENRLVEHPDVEDAAVIGIEHPELGQEPKAFVVPRVGSDLTSGDVVAWCATALARFKVPTEVEFRTELPYTQTGKVMKHQLAREQRAGADL